MFTAKINRQDKVITVSHATLIAAGQFGTPEFHQMMEMRQKFPGYRFEEQKLTANPNKQTHGKLTYNVMQDFIEGYVVEDDEKTAALNEYKAVKALSKTQRAAYAYVKKWFLDKYGEDFKKFQDAQKAKKATDTHLLYNPDEDEE